MPTKTPQSVIKAQPVTPYSTLLKQAAADTGKLTTAQKKSNAARVNPLPSGITSKNGSVYNPAIRPALTTEYDKKAGSVTQKDVTNMNKGIFPQEVDGQITQKQFGASTPSLDTLSQEHGAGVIPSNGFLSIDQKITRQKAIENQAALEGFKTNTIKGGNDPYIQELQKRLEESMKFNGEPAGQISLQKQIADRAEILYKTSPDKMAAEKKAVDNAQKEQEVEQNKLAAMSPTQAALEQFKQNATPIANMDATKKGLETIQNNQPTIAGTPAEQSSQSQGFDVPQQPQVTQTTPQTQAQPTTAQPSQPTAQPAQINHTQTVKDTNLKIAAHYDEIANGDLSVINNKVDTGEIDLTLPEGLQKLFGSYVKNEASAQTREDENNQQVLEQYRIQNEVLKSYFDKQQTVIDTQADADKEQARVDMGARVDDATRMVNSNGQLTTDVKGNYDAGAVALIDKIKNEANKSYLGQIDKIEKQRKTDMLQLDGQRLKATFDSNTQLMNLQEKSFQSKETRTDNIVKMMMDINKAQEMKKMDIDASKQAATDKANLDYQNMVKKDQYDKSQGIGEYKPFAVSDKSSLYDPVTGEITPIGKTGAGFTGTQATQRYNSMLKQISYGKMTPTRISEVRDELVAAGLSDEFDLAMAGSGKITGKESDKYMLEDNTTYGAMNKIINANEVRGLGNKAFQGLGEPDKKTGAVGYDALDSLYTLEKNMRDAQFLKLGRVGYEDVLKKELKGEGITDDTIIADKIQKSLDERFQRIGSVFDNDREEFDNAGWVNTGYFTPLASGIGKIMPGGWTSNRRLALETVSGMNMVKFMKDMSGVAISEQEAQRLMGLVPNVSNSDKAFETNLNNLLKDFRNNTKNKANQFGFDSSEKMENALQNLNDRFISIDQVPEYLQDDGFLKNIKASGIPKEEWEATYNNAMADEKKNNEMNYSTQNSNNTSYGDINPEAMIGGSAEDKQGNYKAIEDYISDPSLLTSAKVVMAFEGLRTEAYPDAVQGWNKPTIAIGQTKGVKKGDTTTQQLAVQGLEQDLKNGRSVIQKYVTKPITPNQEAALQSVILNHGTGFFQRPYGKTLADAINSQDIEAIKKAWVAAGMANVQDPNNKGSYYELPALVKRRNQELELFLKDL